MKDILRASSRVLEGQIQAGERKLKSGKLPEEEQKKLKSQLEAYKKELAKR